MKEINAIACSIFRKEIEHLIGSGKLSGEFTFLDSELHMEPEKLEQLIGKLIKPGCLVCFGDCHARMAEQEMNGELSRIAGLNCVEIFLGRETYRKLRREGAFFLLPEWTNKWERIFKELLGFKDQNVAAEFMNEMHSKFIYVNTGVNKVPDEVLNSISSYFALPVEILDVDLIHLESAIKNGLKQLNNEG